MSILGTPFVGDEVKEKPANDWSSEADKNWDFTINLRGWLNPWSDMPYYTWLHREDQQFALEAENSLSASEAGIACDAQLGPSWVTGNASEGYIHIGCMQDIQRMQLWARWLMGNGPEGDDHTQTGYTQDIQRLLWGQTHANTHQLNSKHKTDVLAEIDVLAVNKPEGGSDFGGGLWSDSELDAEYCYVHSQPGNTWNPNIEGHIDYIGGREVTPTLSEAYAVEEVVS